MGCGAADIDGVSGEGFPAAEGNGASDISSTHRYSLILILFPTIYITHCRRFLDAGSEVGVSLDEFGS